MSEKTTDNEALTGEPVADKKETKLEADMIKDMMPPISTATPISTGLPKSEPKTTEESKSSLYSGWKASTIEENNKRSAQPIEIKTEPNPFVKLGRWCRDTFWGKWCEPRLQTWLSWFVAICGLTLFVILIMGLVAMYNVSVFLGVVTTLATIVWICYAGWKVLGDIIYRAVNATIALLESLKEGMEKSGRNKPPTT